MAVALFNCFLLVATETVRWIEMIDVEDYRQEFSKENRLLENGDWKIYVRGLVSSVTGYERTQYVYLSLTNQNGIAQVIYYSPVMLDYRSTENYENQLKHLPDVLELIIDPQKGFKEKGAGLTLMTIEGVAQYCIVLRDTVRVQLSENSEPVTIMQPSDVMATVNEYASAFDDIENLLERAGLNIGSDVL
jgi:hypothetical protein